MKVIIQGKQMRLSPGLKRYAEEHVVQPLRRFYDNEAAELRVEVGKVNGNRGEAKECHLTFHMPGAKTIQIEQTLPDVFGCLDVAGDRLTRTARKGARSDALAQGTPQVPAPRNGRRGGRRALGHARGPAQRTLVGEDLPARPAQAVERRTPLDGGAGCLTLARVEGTAKRPIPQRIFAIQQEEENHGHRS